MKRLIILIALVMILASVPVLVMSDTYASPTGSNIPDNELTASPNKASNSSTSSTIMITMYTGDGE